MFQQAENLFFQNSCIDFSANVNFLEVPEPVMQAARMGLVAAMQDVQESEGTLEEHVAEWEGVQPEHVFCGNGAAEVTRSLTMVLKPKKALLPAPGFEEYIRTLKISQCSVTYYYTKESDGFRIPLEDFCGQITEDIDLVFLSNPNNPTAALYDRAFIEAVLKQCEAVHAMLILDEVYLDFIEQADELTMSSDHMSRSLFIVKDFTRMFAMSGVRLGYGLCADNELLEQMNKSLLPLYRASAVAQKAGIACTKESEFMQKTVQETTKEREWLLGEFKKLGIEGTGTGNIIFFKTRPRLHVFSIVNGIMLRHCSNLEGMPEGYYRVAVKSHEENEKLIEMLRQWQNQFHSHEQ